MCGGTTATRRRSTHSGPELANQSVTDVRRRVTWDSRGPSPEHTSAAAAPAEMCCADLVPIIGLALPEDLEITAVGPRTRTALDRVGTPEPSRTRTHSSVPPMIFGLGPDVADGGDHQVGYIIFVASVCSCGATPKEPCCQGEQQCGREQRRHAHLDGRPRHRSTRSDGGGAVDARLLRSSTSTPAVSR